MDIRVRTGLDGNIFAYQVVPEKNLVKPQSLAKALWLAPETAGLLTPPSLCSGLGRCGRCKVRFISQPPAATAMEAKILPPDALLAGWRLACAHTIDSLAASVGQPVELALPPPPLPVRRIQRNGHTSATPQHLLLAVDLGTTSLHWRALTPTGALVAEGQEINPQMGAGADVMSRLAYAQDPQGRAQLARRVLLALQSLIASLPAPVQQICLAANTAMTCILLQKDCSGLAAAPYRCDYTGNSLEQVPPLPPVYIPPLPSAFVGGDISAGMAFVQASQQPRYPYLLADMGTNGEFVLALSPHKAYVASIPLGPALEGMGLTFGGMAGPGAQGDSICRFSLQPLGLTPHYVSTAAQAPVSLASDQMSAGQTSVGPLAEQTPFAQPATICATGYLSLLHNLLRLGLLQADGSFCAQPHSPLGARVAQQLYTEHGEPRLALNTDRSLYLSGRDVEEILKVKAAFSLALESLLQVVQIQAADLQHIFLAGAFGEHVMSDDLEALGILPQGAGARVHAVGNSALQGAALLLQQPELRAPLARWSAECLVLDLTADPNFTANYMRHMRFA